MQQNQIISVFAKIKSTSFIKKNCNDLNLQFKNPIMDTVALCRFLFPELKRYKLDSIVKHLGISLQNHHRAVDYTGAMAEILLHCFKILREREILQLNQLNKEFLSNVDIKNNQLII